MPDPEKTAPEPFLVFLRLFFVLKPLATTVSPILAAFFANMRCCLKPDETPARKAGDVFAHVRVMLSIIFFILGVEPAYPLALLRCFLGGIVFLGGKKWTYFFPRYPTRLLKPEPSKI